jgi:hypothetical protein
VAAEYSFAGMVAAYREVYAGALGGSAS